MAPETLISLNATVSPVINFAMHQNRYPLVRHVVIENRSAIDLTHVALRIELSPACAKPCVVPIDVVPAQGMLDAGKIPLLLDATFLSSLTERLAGTCSLSLVRGEDVLAAQDVAVDMLAFDDWPGIGVMPELLAAFVTPNHPEIARLVQLASTYLGQWSGNPSLDGYQSNSPTRIKQQMAAVFSAIQSCSLTYSVPPASFERSGQRIRLCDTMLQQKLGTCLDLTLLYASCLEQMGLNPILVILEGHAFVGVWLEDTCFPEIIQDDVAVLKKRMARGIETIALAECTALTTGQCADFAAAQRTAEESLSATNHFELLIDIKRARVSGIRPLPVRIMTGQGWRVEDDATRAAAGADAQASPETVDQSVLTDAETSGGATFSKKTQWERKLLDLSLRNTLLNLRLTKTVVPVLCSSLAELEDALSGGDDFQPLPKPEDWTDIPKDVPVFELNTVISSHHELLQLDFQNRRLRTALSGTELSQALTDLFRSARLAQEENGANTLYLALGLLKWYESPASQMPRYAPLVLLPVDIVRKSAQKGYVIRLRDEDAQMNITLLEMIKHDFTLTIPGLDPLPADDHGVDIKRVFSIVRNGIMHQARWDVIESSFLGIFSFTQFVMWHDIRNRTDDLARSRIVSSLMDGRLTWTPRPMPDPAAMEHDALLPISADASQLRAIKAASEDMSFVLHGPPGTGKSQTITNIIAKTLAQGKTVLFVAEKMAALSVVQRRLQNIGLNPFWLELHSNKSSKKDVMNQLSAAIDVTRYTTARQFESKAAMLAATRDDLKVYATALHRPHDCGLSLFDLIGAYEDRRDAPDAVVFESARVMTLALEQIEQWQRLVGMLTAAGRATGHPSGHALSAIGQTQYTQTLRANAHAGIERLKEAVGQLLPDIRKASDTLGIELPRSRPELERLAQACDALLRMKDLPPAWLAYGDLKRLAVSLRPLITAGHKQSKLQAALLATWTPAFLEQKGTELFQAMKTAEAAWFLPRYMQTGRLVKQLAPIAKSKLGRQIIATDLEKLVAYQAEKQTVDGIQSAFAVELEGLYDGVATDWDRLDQLCTLASAGESALQAQYLNSSPIRQRCVGIASDHAAQSALWASWQAFLVQFAVLESTLALDPVLLDAETKRGDSGTGSGDTRTGGGDSGYLPGLLAACDRWQASLADLHEWVQWQASRAEANAAGLAPVVGAYEAGLPHDQVLAGFERGLYLALINGILDREPVLGNFTGTVFEEKIAQFRQLDQDLTTLARQEIFARLAAKVPDFTLEAAQSSELGILQRAIRSGGRGTSIRRLFDQIPNLLPRLCPCMLMSPISVAQYLDPKRLPFNLVVFDEASQLPTCKAVGVLARGQEAVIVGDPKQLPPTSFFAISNVDEEHFEIEDLDSILDDCLALSMPETHLLWHYRSRHESLIAFSNMKYYDNSLLTFPSPNDQVSKVRFIPVTGAYDRGHSKQNLAEADAILAEITRRLDDPATRSQSIGVVTFSSVQQNLIDDRLSDLFSQRPDLEERALQGVEPLFVKNLENVQGDERDVILFSVGYGPDEQGKVTLNFGPLNRDGGWRRLNVAVTRARMEMMVFSTLQPEQIDVARTSSPGVIGLRDFLSYARQGVQIAQMSDALRQSLVNGISLQISQALEKHGYQSRRNIGKSGYHIDVGVIDPLCPDEYLLGILLDGQHCPQAQTMRDRTIGQVDILHGLGWQVHRIWTMDWWENSDKEIAKLVARIHKIEVERQQRQRENATKPTEQIAAMPATAKAITGVATIANMPAPPVSFGVPYRVANLAFELMPSDDFLLPQSKRRILARMKQVIDIEAPISEDLLIRRILQSYGIGRAGSRIQARFVDLFRELNLPTTRQEGTVIFWQMNQTPAAYMGFRVGERDARDIPVEEVANAVCAVVQAQFGLPREALLRETAKLFDFARMGQNVTVAMALGIQRALAQKRVQMDEREYVSPHG